MRQRFLFVFLKFAVRSIQRLAPGVICGGAIALGASPGLAVEQVTLQMGPAKTTIQVSDLETFSKTGQVPPRLEWYRPFLNPTVQATLQNRLSIEPAIRDRVIQDLTASSNGHALVDLLADVAPSLSPEVLQTALQAAAETESGVTAISLLQVLPGETLVLEGKALFSLFSQLGLSYLEQTALGNVLNNELESSFQAPLSTQLQPSMPGNYTTERWSVSFRDHERDRVIPVDLYWTTDTQGPLVVLSHGFGADRRFLAYLAEHLASNGLTVVAVEHPGSNVDALVKEDGSLMPTHEFVERPRDVSFILDRLEDLNKNSFFLQGRLNLDQVTLIGHSLGGYTGLVLAGGRLDPLALQTFCADLTVGASSPADWLQCAATDADLASGDLADSRVTQLVVMNPLAGRIFGDTGLRHVKVPTLFLTSTSDSITSVSEQQLQPFNQLSGPRALVAVIGGTHLSVGDPENINPALTQVPFMPELPAEETSQLRQYLNGAVLSFVMQQTKAAKRYQPFLSPEYAYRFSTPALPIRYSDRLPTSLNRWLSSREVLNRRLTPALKSLASLLHLEFIDAQHRIATLRQDAIAQMPMSPLNLSARLPRSLVFYQAAHNQTNRESSHQAESRL
ncbi:MAG: alpha/beta fold hydrolase [Leptolyngbya sp. SIO1D8]|nr:alpha/beta fold hydrolase [Leptolyngbya sp. SIO1D8]